MWKDFLWATKNLAIKLTRLPALVGRRCGHHLVGTSGLEWAHWELQTTHFCVTLQSRPFWGAIHATTAGGGQTSNWIKVLIVFQLNLKQEQWCYSRESTFHQMILTSAQGNSLASGQTSLSQHQTGTSFPEAKKNILLQILFFWSNVIRQWKLEIRIISLSIYWLMTWWP